MSLILLSLIFFRVLLNLFNQFNVCMYLKREGSILQLLFCVNEKVLTQHISGLVTKYKL